MTIKVVVRHFHDGNDVDKAIRGTASYATVARVVDTETGDVKSEDWAFCNPKDQINKKEGRALAIGRALTRINYKEVAVVLV